MCCLLTYSLEKKGTNWLRWKMQHESVIPSNGANGGLVCSGWVQIMLHCVSGILCALRVAHPAPKPCSLSWGKMPRTPGRRVCSHNIPQEAATHIPLLPKATSAAHTQSLCSPLWAPFWAPKTLCWELQGWTVSLCEDSVTSFIIQAKAELICLNFSSSGQTFSCPCFAMGKASSSPR